ncbi:16029_t:CDS:2, partial [Entrophospora sp. SA101]
MSSNTNNSNAFNLNNSNSPNANKPNKPTSSKPKSSRPKSSKTYDKNKKDGFDSTYDPKEDDDHNGRYWENLSREKLERDEENDDNDYMNPGQRQEMLDQ